MLSVRECDSFEELMRVSDEYDGQCWSVYKCQRNTAGSVMSVQECRRNTRRSGRIYNEKKRVYENVGGIWCTVMEGTYKPLLSKISVTISVLIPV